MPVTAKLSKAFYDKLGEGVANELVEWFNSVDATYRSDLRELNELNFARFRAEMEGRFAASDAKLEQLVSELRAEFARLRYETKADNAAVRQDMRDSISSLRAELIKWSFVFFATAALAVIGLR